MRGGAKAWPPERRAAEWAGREGQPSFQFCLWAFSFIRNEPRFTAPLAGGARELRSELKKERHTAHSLKSSFKWMAPSVRY